MPVASLFDIYSQAPNTALIRRMAQTVMEQQERPARQLATLTPTRSDKIKLERMEIAAAGLAPMKAIGASPPVYAPRIAYDQTFIEMIQIHEKRPIKERLMRELGSIDPDVVMRAGADILVSGRQMALRNANRSDYMVMTAILTGQLPLVFEDEEDQGMTIIYDYDPAHFVDGSSWANVATGTPVSDMKAVQELLADSSGGYGVHFWMNAETGHDMIWSNETKALLTGFDGRSQFIPNFADITRRMFEPDKIQFHITNSGWRTEGSYLRGRSAHNKWIPDNKVIVTTADPFEGEPIVEMFDGLVYVRSAFDKMDVRLGEQSWARITDDDTYNWNHCSTRIPRINRPECIAILDVA